MECKDKVVELSGSIQGYNGYVDSKKSNDVLMKWIIDSINRIAGKLSRFISSYTSRTGDLGLLFELIREVSSRIIQDINDRYLNEYPSKAMEEECTLIELDYKIVSIMRKIEALSDEIMFSGGLIGDARFKLDMILEGLKRVGDLMLQRSQLIKSK